MPRTLENLLTVRAPWLGVNQRMADEELPPNRPSSMRNMWIHRHRLEARPGYSKVVPAALPDIQGGPSQFDDNTPLPWQIKQVLVGERDDPRATIFAVVGEYNLWPDLLYLKGNGQWGAIGFPIGAPMVSRGSFVQFYPWIFALFPDSFPNLVGNISNPNSIALAGLRTAGMDTLVGATVAAIEPSPSLPTGSRFPRGVYSFALSAYRSDEGLESNGTTVGTTVDTSAASSNLAIRFTFQQATFVPATHIRIYMKIESLVADENGEFAGGEEAYRLVGELPISRIEGSGTQARTLTIDGLDVSFGLPAQPQPAFSVRGIGPFMPTANGKPPRSRYALPYENKMLWFSAEEDTGGLIFPSQDGFPEYVHPDDFIELPDAIRGDVTGAIVYQGRAVILTDRSIFVLAGTIELLSNDERALGVAAPFPSFSVFRADSDVGCINTLGGNGVIEIEGTLYFNGQNGIYMFDGVKSVKISDAIDELWASLSDTARRSCTMAHDRRNSQLVICYGGPGAAGDPVIVRYDYRAREWCIDDVPKATCVADWIDAEPYYDGLDKSPQRLFLIGTSDEDGLIGFVDERADDDHDQPIAFEWESGDLDFGLPSREKRLHYLTIDTDSATPHLRTDVTIEHADGRRNAKSYQVENTTKAIHKHRLDSRGTRMRIKIAGERSSARGEQRINGFAIDGNPIGRR